MTGTSVLFALTVITAGFLLAFHEPILSTMCTRTKKNSQFLAITLGIVGTIVLLLNVFLHRHSRSQNALLILTYFITIVVLTVKLVNDMNMNKPLKKASVATDIKDIQKKCMEITMERFYLYGSPVTVFLIGIVVHMAQMFK